jgi:hypothetical protein
MVVNQGTRDRQSIWSDVVQFWSRAIVIVVFAALLFGSLFFVAGGSLQSIPRDAFESMAAIEATLLGLTFAAFSVVSTFMPTLRRDFVQSRTFLTLGQTFLVTMLLQLAAFAVAWLSVILSGSRLPEYGGPAVVFVMILSVGFLLALVWDMFGLFRMARTGA